MHPPRLVRSVARARRAGGARRRRIRLHRVVGSGVSQPGAGGHRRPDRRRQAAVHPPDRLVGVGRRAEPLPVRDPRRVRHEDDRPRRTSRSASGSCRPMGRPDVTRPGRGVTDPVQARDVHLGDPERARASTPSTSTFPAAGVWTAAIDGRRDAPAPAPERSCGEPCAQHPDDPDATVSVSFDVKETGVAIPIGGKAPSTRTPTAATSADIPKIATDPSPDPSFYTTSVDEALAKHEPFVLVFATPGFCDEQAVRPDPRRDQGRRQGRAGHRRSSTSSRTSSSTPTAASSRSSTPAASSRRPTSTRAWGILSEPWVFVVDRQRDRPGLVRGGRLARRAQGRDRGRALEARRQPSGRRGRPA